MGRLKSRLIPKRTLKIKKVHRELDDFNYPIEGEEVWYLDGCTVHPADSREIGLTEEGYRDKKCFKIVSRGDITALSEGDTSYYLIEAMPDIWCSIVRDSVWTNNVQNHVLFFVIETNER